MKKALIVIDFVNDFVADGGKLTCGAPAQNIDENIAKLVDEFSKNGDFIVIASDNHKDGDSFNPESTMFPAHCLEGTIGCDLYGHTSKAVEKVSPNQLIHIQKSRYSSFAGTPLDLKLRERGVNQVYLVGVCSDICVLHTAVDAYNLNYQIFVYEKGIATFNPEGQAFVLNHFKNTLGATIL